jgi:serine/threonine protein kinase
MEAYTVLSKLGQGACGSVFLVESSDGGRFALKRVATERLSAAERKAILREVQLLSQLKHPNIIGCAAQQQRALASPGTQLPANVLRCGIDV